MSVAIKIRKHTSYSVETNGKSFETFHQPIDYKDPLIEVLPDGRTLIGYLSHDSDCENPLDSCDGMGKILDRRRDHGRKDDEQQIRDAMGTDSYGQRVRKPQPYAVFLDVYSHGSDTWRVNGSGRFFPDERWDVSTAAGIWVPDKSCIEHIESEGIKKGLPGVTVSYHSQHNADGTCITRPCRPGEHSYFNLPDGTPANTRPDERFNNVITYKLPDGRTRGGYKTFTTAYRAAARALGINMDTEFLLKARREVAVECAGQAVDEFNKWLSGDCYGIVVQLFDEYGEPDENEGNGGVWGFIGMDHAETSLQDEFDAFKKCILKKSLPQ